MNWKPSIWKGFAVLGALLVCVMAYPFVVYGVRWIGGNHYPSTAQQAACVSLGSQGKQVATRLMIYADDHGWPNHLSEIVGFEGTTKEMLQYPRIYDLPDRRDLAGWKDFDEWIYIKPRETAPELPLLIAPLPYTSCVGHRLPKPQRIIVHRDTVVDWVDEDRIASILRALSER